MLNFHPVQISQTSSAQYLGAIPIGILKLGVKRGTIINLKKVDHFWRLIYIPKVYSVTIDDATYGVLPILLINLKFKNEDKILSLNKIWIIDTSNQS